MGKAIVRLDNVAATKNPALIKSAKYMGDGTTATAIENGMFVAIGGLMEDEREIHVATTPAVDSTYFGIVTTPEVDYNEIGYNDLDTFENPADEPIRVTILQKGDIYSVTAEGFNATPVKDQLVELQAGVKAKVVDEATSGSTQIGKIIDIDTVGRFTFYAVEVQ